MRNIVSVLVVLVARAHYRHVPCSWLQCNMPGCFKQASHGVPRCADHHKQLKEEEKEDSSPGGFHPPQHDDFILSGGYDAASKKHRRTLQEVIDGLLHVPELDLRPLHALVGMSTDWTIDAALQQQVAKVYMAVSGGVTSSIDELQARLDVASSDLLKVDGLVLSEDVMQLIKNNVDMFSRQLQTRQGQDQQLADVKEMLEKEIESLKQAEEHAALHRLSIKQSMLFLTASVTNTIGH